MAKSPLSAMRYFCLLSFFALCIIGCDSDEPFRMKTKAAYLLMLNPQTKQIETLVFSDDTKRFAIEEPFQKVNNLSGNWNEWATSSTVTSDPIAYFKNKENKNSLELEQSWAKLPTQPHLISLGDKEILAADSTQHILYFIRKNKTSQVISRPLADKPLFITYKSGKFYVGTKNHISVWDESAFVERIKIPLPSGHLLAHITPSIGGIPVYSTKGDSAFSGIISWNGDELSALHHSNIKQGLYTPYRERNYGKELLSNCSLSSKGDLQVLSTPSLLVADSVSSFAVDFFQSQIYYTRNGVLYKYNVIEQKNEASYQTDRRIEQSYFQVSYQNH